MVYCGKPSKGCSNCRSKRTKCDLARPGCGQCRRAGRLCLGYRDQANLMFRDQSQDTASKFHIVEANGRQSSSPSNQALSSEAEDFSSPSSKASSSSFDLALAYPTEGVVTNSLRVSPEDQAACYFFANYVFNVTGFRKGYNEYLPGIYANVPPSSPLASIITSLGMAGLANIRGAPEAKAVSTFKYTSALHGVNALLQDPARATEDETLITVLLLGLYETNNGVAAQSLKAWAEHISGAMALISLRGQSQLNNKIGLQLFYQLRSQIMIGCLHRRVPVPENVVEWSRLACNLATQNSEPVPENQLAEICFRFNNFRATDLSSFQDYRDPLRNIEVALGFDAELKEWLINFEVQYAFTTVPTEYKCDDVFSDYYHIYPCIFTAVIWNHYRCTRLLVNEIVVTQIVALYYQSTHPSAFNQPRVDTGNSKNVALPSSFPYANNFYASHALLTTLAHDVCASVPYYLHFHIHGTQWDKVQPPPAAAKGNLLLWPLYLVGQLQAASPMMRMWVIDRMKRVTEIMGVKQAGMIASYLGRGEDLTIQDKLMGRD